MRKIVLLVAVLIGMTAVSEAQLQRYYIGPSILFKGGLNATDIPEGLKTDPNFNGLPDFGITFKWMFDKNSALGLLVDANYATYSYRMRPENESLANDNNTFVIKPQYFTLAPGLYFSGVTLGVAFGFPASYTINSVAGGDGTGSWQAFTDDLNGPADRTSARWYDHRVGNRDR